MVEPNLDGPVNSPGATEETTAQKNGDAATPTPDPPALDAGSSKSNGAKAPGRAALAGNGMTQESRELAQRFHSLAEQWHKETGYVSSLSQKVSHPAYREIMEMGEAAIPLILKELSERPAHWFVALKQIVGHSPVAAQDRTDPHKARAAWLAWGKQRGAID